MARKQFGPVGECGAPRRAGTLCKLDSGQNTTITPIVETPAPPWPVRLLARRHGLTVAHAALVASLAFPALPAEVSA